MTNATQLHVGGGGGCMQQRSMHRCESSANARSAATRTIALALSNSPATDQLAPGNTPAALIVTLYMLVGRRTSDPSCWMTVIAGLGLKAPEFSPVTRLPG